jgi:hypothetical protein
VAPSPLPVRLSHKREELQELVRPVLLGRRAQPLVLPAAPE